MTGMINPLDDLIATRRAERDHAIARGFKAEALNRHDLAARHWTRAERRERDLLRNLLERETRLSELALVPSDPESDS